MKTIAIIDDDIYIGNMLEEVLNREGFCVLRAYSGTEALYLLDRKRPDLVLLDLMLPGLPGEQVLDRIKEIPVIVISAKVDVDNKVRLLLGGAADYVTKPFEIRELLARIEVQLRDHKTGICPVLHFGDLTLDEASRQVMVGEIPVRLTKTEFAILKLLMRNPSQALSKSVILDRISQDTPDCTEASLKIHVSNLRKKLKEVCDCEYIQAVWGIGFKLKKPDSAESQSE